VLIQEVLYLGDQGMSLIWRLKKTPRPGIVEKEQGSGHKEMG